MSVFTNAVHKQFRIQYVSDLHLELYKQLPPFQTLLKPSAPYLALAGDIGQPIQLRLFFNWASPQWKQIFYVAGNHEYYNLKKYGSTMKTSMEERKWELDDVCQSYPNIHFLHSSAPSHYLEEENVAVVGSTVWTDPSPHEDSDRMNDYHCIYTNDGLLTTSQVGKIHKQEKEVLDAEITKWGNKGAQICMITHHMPSPDLIEAKYRGCGMNSFFAADCSSLLRYPVALWIYGHTHSAGKLRTVNRVPCVINARGYKDEHVNGFAVDAVQEIPWVSPQEVESVLNQSFEPLRHFEEGFQKRQTESEEDIVFQ